MSSSSLEKAGAVTSEQLEENLNPRSPGNPCNAGPERALPLPVEKIVISPTELIVESVGETSLVPAAETGLGSRPA